MQRVYGHVVVSATLLLLISGLAYYFAAPLNWGAGEAVLLGHMYVGVAFALYMILALPIHYRTHVQRIRNRAFLANSWSLTLLLLLVVLSGAAHFLPYLSYFTDKVFYYRFETYDLLSAIHLLSAAAMGAALIMHLNLSYSKDPS